CSGRSAGRTTPAAPANSSAGCGMRKGKATTSWMRTAMTSDWRRTLSRSLSTSLLALGASTGWRQTLSRLRGWAAAGRRLDPLLGGDRPLAPDVAGVDGRLRLEQQHVHLVFGDRPVLDPARDDHELARVEHDLAVPQLDPQPAPDHVEQLVLRLMVVPDE